MERGRLETRAIRSDVPGELETVRDSYSEG